MIQKENPSDHQSQHQAEPHPTYGHHPVETQPKAASRQRNYARNVAFLSQRNKKKEVKPETPKLKRRLLKKTM
jgi:hypothetical protein